MNWIREVHLFFGDVTNFFNAIGPILIALFTYLGSRKKYQKKKKRK